MTDQSKYDFIEDGPDERAKKFYDFVWEHFRNQMRVMIIAYVETEEGRKLYEEYLESFE